MSGLFAVRVLKSSSIPIRVLLTLLPLWTPEALPRAWL